ncbi:Hypothetical protein MVR_LOCUS143 [uncultured virus]|nr:Hypothetical protein MVR_LOCUS143 [uncultured virus]
MPAQVTFPRRTSKLDGVVNQARLLGINSDSDGIPKLLAKESHDWALALECAEDIRDRIEKRIQEREEEGTYPGVGYTYQYDVTKPYEAPMFALVHILSDLLPNMKIRINDQNLQFTAC